MKSYLVDDWRCTVIHKEKLLKRILLGSGVIAIISFLFHIVLTQQTFSLLFSDPVYSVKYQTIGGSDFFLHTFILLGNLFSISLFFYFKQIFSDGFVEATKLMIACQVLLTLRSFVLIFDPNSFVYLVLAGIQLILVIMSLFFYLINFLNRQQYLFYALVILACLVVYIGSILYTLVLSEFTLPNTGSLLVDVIVIATLTVFVYSSKSRTA